MREKGGCPDCLGNDSFKVSEAQEGENNNSDCPLARHSTINTRVELPSGPQQTVHYNKK